MTDWDGAAEVCFWSAWWETAQHMEKWLSDDDLDRAVKDLDLPRVADISLALYQCNGERHAEWVQKQLPALQARLAHEYSILVLERQEDILRLHYWPIRYDQGERGTSEGKQTSGDPYHEQTMERIRLTRRLFPGYRAYGTQGYGYRIGHLPLPVDESSVNKDGVPASMLPPAWPVRVNAVASGLARNRFRPGTWAEYVDLVLETRRLVVTCLDQLHRGLLKCLQRRKGLNLCEKYVDATLWDRCLALLGDLPLLPRSAVDPWGFAHEFLSNEFVERVSQQTGLPRAIALQKYKPYLDAERDFSSSLISFFQQSPNVMVANLYVGKLPTYSAQRDRLLEALQGQGVKTDLAFLSTYNLTTAKKQLAAYQDRFRLLFGHMVDDELCALEARERDLLLNLWPLWYVFAYNPDQAWASPATQVPSRVNLVKHEIMKRVQQALDGISEEGCHVTVLPTKEDWDGASTLWLRLDLRDPTKLYTKFEELLIALRDSIGPVEYGKLDHYVIESHWEYIAVLPVMQGRMLNRSAWRLLTFGAVLSAKEPGENPWLYVPLPIPSGAWESLGVDLWDLEDLRVADRLSESVAGLYLRVSQLGEFGGMPELPEAAHAVAQSYAGGQNKEINGHLQAAFDTMAEMVRKSNELPEQEQEERGYLQQILAGLAELAQLVKPSKESGSSWALGIGELADYAQRLEQAQQLAEGIKLFWVADILSHQS